MFAFFATTAKGMEELLEKEIADLGAQAIERTRAGVKFKGTLETGYRVCLWSRVANRVLLPLKTFPAPTPEKLYGGVKSIRWSDHLTPAKTLSVDFQTSQSQITHSQFGALKTKDAICDQFKSNTGERPSVDTARPDIRVNVYLHRDEATVSIDLSGDSLHRRGYRELGAEAPLKENLAAAILLMAGWPERLKEARAARMARAQGQVLMPLPAFLDPMCGTGTLPIEAALIALNRAPGLMHEHFGFQGWNQHDSSLWRRILDEAKAGEITDRKLLPKIVGYDCDFRAVRVALTNVERAKLGGIVHIEKRELGDLEGLGSKGMLCVNPPYGERMGEVEALKPLYKQLGDLLKQRLTGWDGFVFTSSPDLANAIGLASSRRFVLFNGALECRLLKYEMYDGTRRKRLAAPTGLTTEIQADAGSESLDPSVA